MKPWKAALGLGAACVACCAIPLLGLAGLASTGSLLLAFADEFLPLAVALLAMALALTTAWWWQRRQASRKATCDCGPTCPTKAPDASS